MWQNLFVIAKSWLLLTTLLFLPATAGAQTDDGEKELAVVEVGAAASQSLTGGGFSGGPTVAVEVTPIENWLELETGVTSLLTAHSTEWDADFLFKKPWTLSRKVEFMAGLGPEWIHTSENHISANAVGLEVIGDFMFWPSVKHRFGWYLEPGYDYSFGRGHEQSLGISGGLLIAITRRNAKH
jgi:hypothetical protein